MKSTSSTRTGNVINVAYLPMAHANIKGDMVTDPRDEFHHNRISQYRPQHFLVSPEVFI